MNTTLFQEQAIFWLNYFQLSKGELSQVWLLSNSPSLYIPSTQDFESNKFGVSIIDQFDGRRPWLFNYRCSQLLKDHKKYNVGTIGMIIFDSQMIGLLSAYMNNYDSMESDQKAVIKELLQFIIQKGNQIGSGTGFDTNPSFYYIESLVKNGINDRTIKRATETGITILRLHTMDEEAFLKHGRIVPSKERIEDYAERYGINPANCDLIKDIVPLWVKDMIAIDESQLKMYRENLNYTYVALLKMVLIHKASKGNIIEKTEEFWNFLEQELGGILGRENFIAAYYFSKQLPSKFIGIEASMTFAKFRKNMMATAWDVFLLRMPEILLSIGTEQETFLCYICTADKTIRKLGRLFTIESLRLQNDSNYLPMIDFKMDELRQNLGEEIVDNICDRQRQKQIARSEKIIANKVKPISTEQLNKLITELENQTKAYCKAES